LSRRQLTQAISLSWHYMRLVFTCYVNR